MGRAAFLKELIARRSDAHSEGFYFEACWYAHGIFEDRTKRICEHVLAGSKNPPNEISQKILIIREWHDQTKAKVVDGKPQRKPKNEGAHKIKVPKNPVSRLIEPGFLSRLQKWTKDRNDLVHKLAYGDFDLEEIDELKSDLSERGGELVNEICATAMRIKKHKKRR